MDREVTGRDSRRELWLRKIREIKREEKEEG